MVGENPLRPRSGAGRPTCIPTRSGSHHSPVHSSRTRASAVGALALAGVFLLLATDQAPGIARRADLLGKVLRKNNVLRRSLTVNDYEKVMQRALASTESLSMENVDFEKIVRRALEETSSSPSRSLTSDNANYNIIKAAQLIRDDHDNKVPFVFVMQVSSIDQSDRYLFNIYMDVDAYIL